MGHADRLAAPPTGWGNPRAVSSAKQSNQIMAQDPQNAPSPRFQNKEQRDNKASSTTAESDCIASVVSSGQPLPSPSIISLVPFHHRYWSLTAKLAVLLSLSQLHSSTRAYRIITGRAGKVQGGENLHQHSVLLHSTSFLRRGSSPTHGRTE